LEVNKKEEKRRENGNADIWYVNRAWKRSNTSGRESNADISDELCSSA